MKTSNYLRVEALEAREVPAGDLAYAIGLTGLSANMLARTVVDGANNTYVIGSFTGTVDLDPSTTGVSNVTSAGGTDAFVAKYSPSGLLVWAKSFGGTGDDVPTDAAIDGAANIYIGGTFSARADFDPDPAVTRAITPASGGSAFVAKLNTAGTFVMARAVVGSSTLTGLAVTPRGDITAVGKFRGTADFDPGAGTVSRTTTNTTYGAGYVWRLDPLGAHVFSGAFESTRGIDIGAVAVDPAGNTYIGGRAGGVADINPTDAKFTLNAGTNWTPFITKVSNGGVFQWARATQVMSAVSNAPNRITAMGVDGAGNVIAAGEFAGTIDFDSRPSILAMVGSNARSVDGFAWSLSRDGNLTYARGFGGANAETVADLAVDAKGNAYMTGTFTGVADFDPGRPTVNLISGTGATDAFVLKLARNGNLAYTRSVGGGSSVTQGSGIFADNFGNITVTGGFSGRADFNPGDAVNALTGGEGAGFAMRLMPAPNSPVGPTNTAPILTSAGGPYVITEGQGLTVSAKASDNGFNRLTYTWDLNGDGVFGDVTGQKATITPARMAQLGLDDSSDAPIEVRVRVTDGVNLPVEMATTLTIENVAPQVSLSAPTSAAEGSNPVVRASVGYDPSSDDRAAGVRYSYDFNNDGVFDLGNGDTFDGSVADAVVSVPDEFGGTNGILTVRVRAFDKDGGYTDATSKIAMTNSAPTAKFSRTTTAISGLPTTFKFTNAVDSTADVEEGLTYGFDFNNDGVYEFTGSSPERSFVFSFPGQYTVNGAVSDSDGAFTEYTLTFNVTE